MSRLTKPWSIVGCSNCGQKQMASAIEYRQTVECSHCGATHTTKKLRKFAACKTADEARNRLTVMRMKRSGSDQNPNDVLFTSIDEEADEVLTDYNDLYEEQVSDQPEETAHSKVSKALYEELHEQNTLRDVVLESYLEDRPYGASEETCAILDDIVEKMDEQRFADAGPLPQPTGAGLSASDSQGTRADITLTVDGSATRLWDQLTADEYEGTWYAALQRVADHTGLATATDLVDAGVTGVDGLVAHLFEWARDYGTEETWEMLWETIQSIGGNIPADIRTGTDDMVTGPLALLCFVEDAVLDVELQFDTDFWSSSARERRNAVEVIDALADCTSVRLVASNLQSMKLYEMHAQDSAHFSSALQPRRLQPSGDDQTTEAINALRDHDDRINVLRAIVEEPTQTITNGELAAQLPVSKGRVSQIVTSDEGSFTDLGLVQGVSTGRSKQWEATGLGTRVLSRLDEEIGQQTKLDGLFSGASKPCDNNRGLPGPQQEGEETVQQDPAEEERLHEVRWLPKHRADAVTAAATPGAVATVDHAAGEEKLANAAEAQISWDGTAEELVVSVESHDSLQMAVCLVRGLCGHKARNRVLTDERLNRMDLPTRLLRRSGGLGWLTDDAMAGDWSSFRGALEQAVGMLCTLTRNCTQQHRREDSESYWETRGEALSLAQGIIGTVTHVYHHLGVDVVREIRLPNCGRDFIANGRAAELFTTLGISASITSTYGGLHSHFKQVFECRPEKLRERLGIDVDPENPWSEMIGATVITGENVSQVEPILRKKLDDPHEVNDTATEIASNIPIITETTRDAYAETASRVLGRKNLRPSRAGVSLLQALCRSPMAAARALNRLGTEKKTDTRAVTLAEVRYGLTELSEKDILPGETPTTKKALLTLFEEHDERLSTTALADAAGVSRQSIHNNSAALQTLGLVLKDDEGWRVALPSRTEETHARRRGDSTAEMDIVPDILVTGPTVERNEVDLLFDVVLALEGVLADDAFERADDAMFTANPLDEAYGITDRLDCWIDAIIGLCGLEIEPRMTRATPGALTTSDQRTIDAQQNSAATTAAATR